MSSYHAACLLQRSGWTRNLEVFLEWLSALRFEGGGFGEAAIADGLAEALMVRTVYYIIGKISQILYCLTWRNN